MNKLELVIGVFVSFHTCINEMHGSRSKIPSKKISAGSIMQRDLILALKG
jgi:hypothetical protein